MTTFLAGLGLGLSLIVAIGAQNVFVLRQGIRREHVALVVTICILSDAVLILAGVAGLGLLVSAAPWVVEAARWAGAAFLLVYGALAARRALRPSGEVLDAAAGDASPVPNGAAAPSGGVALATAATRTAALPVALTCLALTWLNPHVYLDTVFLIGSIASTHGDGRWLFAAGAVLGSILWFTALGVGARVLGRVLNTPRAWRILDAIVAVVMLAIAISLVLG
ncbi:LysE/ArgO family amino acid transporter [Agromyces seonyuensis]|uniref:LysE family transporter n=1 Tax=Agromyces seonyuensis TaxID=2662446 RepID=A0A6I4NYB1_9MICO|nr:LysE/ArgO family amino acid transporter [Agromyces seonyuensis]MWB99360.1 LysE family transporter [Agromyces seonyuensis]